MYSKLITLLIALCFTGLAWSYPAIYNPQETFQTMNAPNGSDPVANGVETLNFASSDSTITITGDSVADQLDFIFNTAPASQIIYDGTETVEEILDDTLNKGVLDAITVTASGSTDVQWTAGEIFDHNNTSIVDTDAGFGTLTNNTINYLIWTAGTTLTLGTTAPDESAGEIGIAHIGYQDATIYHIHEEEIISTRETAVVDGLANIIPVVTTSGLIVSEDTDVTNVWDVESTSGTYFHDGHARHDHTATETRVTAMVRHYKTAGAWDSDTNAEIDSTQYNDGTDLAAVTSNRYYKSMFFIVDNTIHWVYPDAEYTLLSGAIAAANPTIPPGLSDGALSVAVVLRGNATAFPASGDDQWIDIRQLVGGSASAVSISDHGNLTGLTDDDHTQYVLVDGTRAITGAQEVQAGIKFMETGTPVEGITLTATTNMAGDYTVSFPDAACSEGEFWSFTATGDLACGTAGVTGANTALSNLAAVAINTSLISDTANTDDFGTSAIPWRTAYLKTGLALQETGVGTDNLTFSATASLAASGALTFPDACSEGETWIHNGSGHLYCGAGGGVGSPLTTDKFWYGVAGVSAELGFDELTSSLISDTADTYDIGSTTYPWDEAFVNALELVETGAGTDTVTLTATGAVTASYNMVMPAAAPTEDDSVLSFNTNGVASFTRQIASPISDWADTTTCTGSWTTNTTYTCQYRRNGDEMEVRVHMAFAGAPDSTDLTLTVANGKSIDSTKHNWTTLIDPVKGQLSLNENGTGVNQGKLVWVSATTIQAFAYDDSGTYEKLTAIDETTPMTVGSGDTMDLWYSVPIDGWTSSTEIVTVEPSKGFTGKVLDTSCAPALGNSSVNLANVPSDTDCDNIDFVPTNTDWAQTAADKHSVTGHLNKGTYEICHSGSTLLYAASQSYVTMDIGLALAVCSGTTECTSADTIVSNDIVGIKNRYSSNNRHDYYLPHNSCGKYVVTTSGQYTVSMLYTITNVGGFDTSSLSTSQNQGTMISVTPVSSVSVADLENCFVSLYRSANQSISNGGETALQFDTEDEDECGIGTTGASAKVTVNRDGLWCINAGANPDGALGWGIDEYLRADVYKNGSFDRRMGIHWMTTSDATGSGPQLLVAGSYCTKLVVGDEITLSVYHTETSAAKDFGNAQKTNFLQMYRIP